MEKMNNPNDLKCAKQENHASPAMILFLTPTIEKTIHKMKIWMSSIAGKSIKLGSSEVVNSTTENGLPIFNNDYAPPIAQKEIDSLPVPDGLVIEQTQEPEILLVRWNKINVRHLCLLQVNVENPSNPTCWITHSVSSKTSIEIEDVDAGKPIWIRVCIMGKDGRSKWAMIGKQI